MGNGCVYACERCNEEELDSVGPREKGKVRDKAAPQVGRDASDYSNAC